MCRHNAASRCLTKRGRQRRRTQGRKSKVYRQAWGSFGDRPRELTEFQQPGRAKNEQTCESGAIEVLAMMFKRKCAGELEREAEA
jgi:hypothetical protein